MPFKKGDPQTKAWAKQGNEIKKELKATRLEFLHNATDLIEYDKKKEKLRNGKMLSPPELLWMDKFENTLEFNFAKRAREDGKGNADTGAKVFISGGNREEAKEAISNFLNE